MNQPKRYAIVSGSFPESLTAIARLPGMLKEAHERWKRVRFVVEEAEDSRSIAQNKLQRKWCKEAAAQGDMTAEEYRGYCKLHFGMAILCRDSDQYLAACQKVLGGLTYEQKLALMMQPHDYPVTRGMTKRQKTEYLNECYQHFTGLGFRLTEPSLQGYEEAA
jgi:hypothetical protein